MNEEIPTIQLLASSDMLKSLLDAVNFRLETWPGGEPEEQEMLVALQRLLFAASLELLVLD